MQKLAGVLLASALAGSAFLFAEPAGAAASLSPVSPGVCGATLTTNTTLTHDLHCPTGPGLILVGNIILNLGGHGIYGANETDWGAIQTDSGVEPNSGPAPTVTNGRIQEWGGGINGGSVNVSHVTFVHLGTAIGTLDGTVQVTDSTFEYDDFGLSGELAFDTVTHSSFFQVGTSIRVVNGGNITASYDTFSAPAGTSGQATLGVYNSEAGGSVDHSTFTNIKSVVYNYFGVQNLTDVTISGATTGYQADFFGTGTLTNVAFAHNVTAVYIDEGSNVTVTGGALFEYNNQSLVVKPAEYFPSSFAVNTATFYKNYGDGLSLALPGSSLKSVQAIDNAGHGIVVVAGTTNLGGNKAYGNKKSPQCVGLVCSH